MPHPGYATPTLTPVTSLNTARFRHTATLLPSGKVLVSGWSVQSNWLASAEVYDPISNTWTTVTSMNTARNQHTSTLLPSGKVLVVGGFFHDQTGGQYLTSVEVYDPISNNWTAVASMNIARERHTATLLPSGKVLVAGGEGTGGYLASVELYDPDANTWMVVSSLNNARENHTATLLPNGKVLVAGGYHYDGSDYYLTSAEIYDPSSNTWLTAGSLNTGREYPTAILLPNGKVLVSGGYNLTDGQLTGSEMYDPSSNTWTVVASLNTEREYHTATLLPSGKVLVVGGYNGSYLTSAEVYDPHADTWTTVASLNTAREYHTATLLPGGEVLVAGGVDNSNYLASAEVYDDPSAGSWTNADSLNADRDYHTATLLPSGKVLVAGGENSGGSINNVDLYDPSADTWSSAAPLNTARYSHAATLLPDGRVLVTGGWNGSYLKSVEVYDPSTNAWTTVEPMNTPRGVHTATLLPSGEVLVAGGWDATGYPLNVEVYDPGANTWTTVASLNTSRGDHTATLLPSGKVLVAGGWNGYYHDSAELYDPIANTWTIAGAMNTARTRHTATLLPNGKVLIAGGYNSSDGRLKSAELYDPVTDTWNNVSSLNTTRERHTATLLHNGKVLVTGGKTTGGNITSGAEVYDPSIDVWTTVTSLSNARWRHTSTLLLDGKVLVVGGENSGGYLISAELFDRGLGFEEVWRPTVNTVTSPVVMDDPMFLTGFGYRGYLFTEASSGGTNSSATSYPLVQLMRIDNEQWLWLSPSASSFNNTTYTSLPVTGTLAGPSLVTVFVNGIPGDSRPINLNYPTSTSIDSPTVTYSDDVSVTLTVTSIHAIPLGSATLSFRGMSNITNLTPIYGSSPPRAMAHFDLANPGAGVYALSASYDSQGNFGSSHAYGFVNVNKAATTTLIVSSKNPSIFGQTVIFTATIGSGAGTPTGTVTFKNGATTLGTSGLTGSVACFSTDALSVGTHSITAEYNGDNNFNASSGTLAGGQVVNNANTLVLLNTSPNPTTVGQTVTMTATVGIQGVSGPETPNACMLTGSVDFIDGASILGNVALDSNCQAIFNTDTLEVGKHPVTAEYSGDGSYTGSASNLVELMIDYIYHYFPWVAVN